MPWLPRGLREGVVTSPYPKRHDGYGAPFRGAVAVAPVAGAVDVDVDVHVAEAARACPTAAITTETGVRLDRGRCILCGRCVELAPDVFAFDTGFETAGGGRGTLVVPPLDDDADLLAEARRELASRVRALRRSVHVRHVDAGSDGSDEWEVAALTNPVYDVQRLGIFFTASPKHADLLLVTGVGTAGMTGAVRQTFDVMPHPKVVVAAGADAASGGLVGEGYAARGGVHGAVPVDVYVPGSPPSPFGLLYGILLAAGILSGPMNGATAALERAGRRGARGRSEG